MKQIINAHTTPGWPNIEVEFDKPIELFIDSFQGYDAARKSFKILWVKESEEISKFKSAAIEHHAKFDAVIAYDEEILNTCNNSHFLAFGTSWIQNYDLNTPKKFQISHLTGFKEITEGHILRKKVYYKQNRIKNPIDFYISQHGGVENSFNNKTLFELKNPLFDSQFHICIENSRQKNFFTEKLIDCLVTKTIPIYWGCENIENFFDTRGFIIANSFEDIINSCNSINENTYNEKAEFINKNFELSEKYITIIDRLETTINKILNNMSNENKFKEISIVIPTYEMYDFGADFLEFNFKKLKEQTFVNFEVVVSDHSKDDKIKELCKKYSNFLDIRYYRNLENLGNSSANINNAIKLSNGKIIKILFQDDFLLHKDSLKDIKESFDNNPNKKWLLSSCEHSKNGTDFYNTFIPEFNREKLLSGINTISSPSVVSFLREYDVKFDENIVWMMDCDYYIRMQKELGDPIILNQTNVVNRIWEKQYNNMISNEIKTKETEYIKNKFIN